MIRNMVESTPLIRGGVKLTHEMSGNIIRKTGGCTLPTEWVGTFSNFGGWGEYLGKESSKENKFKYEKHILPFFSQFFEKKKITSFITKMRRSGCGQLAPGPKNDARIVSVREGLIFGEYLARDSVLPSN